MLRSVKDLMGYPAVARDGRAGKVRDLLFGDRQWRSRYIEVDTRKLFRFSWHYISEELADGSQATRFLIPTDRIGSPTMGSGRHVAPLQMEKQDLLDCPTFADIPTVEQQLEEEFRLFLGHAVYDDRPLIPTAAGVIGYEPPVSAYQHSESEILAHRARVREIAGEHLHSARAVLGYNVMDARGDLIGRVNDFVLDVDQWRLVYFVLDTRHGIPSRKHLLEMPEIRCLDWSASSLDVELKAEELADRRRYWAFDPVNRDEAGKEYDYYGRLCSKNLMEEYY